MELEKLLCMKGGKGEASYANNSQPQAIHARSVLPFLKETLDIVQLDDNPNVPFAIVDLGCSCGTNTISTVNTIINHIIKRYEVLGFRPPEFSAFFSDLPSNDFNNLFQLLPSLQLNYAHGDYNMVEEYLTATGNHRSCFVAGVPGSFYRRLFPARSINFFHSAFSLQWLSKVPESVLDKESSAYNKGKVFINGASESTENAYKNQFKTDLASFLSSRSIEIKHGGSMFLVCVARTEPDPTHKSGPGFLFGTHFQDAWDDLVQQGLISNEKRDEFNVPLYAPSVEEFKEVVEAEGSFIINKLELFKGGSPIVVSQPDNQVEVGKALANSCRTVCGVLVDAHIGERLGNELFSLVASRAANQAEQLLEQLQFFHIIASLSPN